MWKDLRLNFSKETRCITLEIMCVQDVCINAETENQCRTERGAWEKPGLSSNRDTAGTPFPALCYRVTPSPAFPLLLCPGTKLVYDLCSFFITSLVLLRRKRKHEEGEQTGQVCPMVQHLSWYTHWQVLRLSGPPSQEPTSGFENWKWKHTYLWT